MNDLPGVKDRGMGVGGNMNMADKRVTEDRRGDLNVPYDVFCVNVTILVVRLY